MEKETRLKRLYFRSAHRGSKETDLILGPYAAARLKDMSEVQIDEFEAFLAESDTDIWNWVIGKYMPPENLYITLIDDLRKLYDVSN